MPHSSGGGSHGGGSHHSSSHSSHSSRSGSSSPRRVSNVYFPGSRRFLYFDRHDQPVYAYADYDITKKRSPMRFLILLFYIPFVVALYFMAKDMILPPKKLKTDYNTAIAVRDNINVLEDTEKLKRSLQAFYDKTGISPAVFTVYNEDWQDRYSNLENYAYDLYVNAFPDEKHWLIVYSEPKEPDPEFNEWYWEGMQGDDTDPILTYDKAEIFNNKLQRYLTENSKSVSEAISFAFDELTPEIMKMEIEPASILTFVFFGGFIAFHAFFMVFYDPNKKYRNAVEYPVESPTDKLNKESCPFCGAEYIKGKDLRCPSCQALLEISENKQ
ncbi:MAG: hypothetical protein ACI4YB_11810 [Oscillospiraceae bacterium]